MPTKKTESVLKSLVRPADFEAGDRIERLYMHRLEPAKCKLNEREQKHFFRVRFAMILMMNPKTAPSQVVWMLQNDLGIKRTTAQTIVSQVPLVFPDLVENSRQLEKEDAVSKLHAAIGRCEERDTTEDDANIARLIREIREIRQWSKEDLGLKKGDIVIPQPMWTDDPAVLDLDKGSDTAEDAQWEELDDDTGSPQNDDDNGED